MKKLQQNIYVIYTILFIIIVGIIFSIFFINDKTFIWQADGLKQHFIILKDFHEAIREFISNPSNGLDLFSWEMGLGMDVIGQYSYYVLGDSFAYLSLLFPTQYLEIVYSCLIILRLYFIGIAFIQYAKYHHANNHQNSQKNILLGAILYTFSSFALFAGVRHPYFLNAMILFPFLLLGVDKLLKENKKVFLTVWVAISAISNYYFFYMHTIMLIIYAIIQYFCEYRKEGIKHFFRKLGSGIFIYIIGILIASIILLPTIYAFLNSARTGEDAICQYSLDYYKSLFSINLFTVYGDNWSYIGVSSIILVMLPVLLMRRKQYKVYFTYLIVATLFLIIPILGSFMNGFSFPNNRWSFIYAFILSYIVTLCLDSHYSKKEIKAMNLIMILYTAIAVIGILCCKIESTYVIYLVQIILAFFMLGCIWYQNNDKVDETSLEHVKKNKMSLNNKIHKVYPWQEKLYKNRFTIAIFSLSIISIILMAFGLYSSYDRNYAKEFIAEGQTEEKLATQLGKNESYAKNIQNILQTDHSFYRIAKIPHHVQNLSIYYGYSSTECFLSIGNQYVYNLNLELADYQHSTTSCIRGLGDRTKITTLLGTKYYVVDEKNENNIPYGYLLKDEQDGVKTYENQYALPIGVVYTQYMIREAYESLSPLEKEDALLKVAVVDEQDIQNTQYREMKEKTDLEDIKQSNQIVPYQLIDEGNIVKEGKVETTKNNQSIDLEIGEVENAELYVYIYGFEFQGNNGHSITASFNDKKVTKTIENKITSAYYQSAPEILLPLGYYEKTSGKINLKFSAKGTYEVEKIEVIAVPMDSYEATIANLQKNELKNVSVSNREIKGTVNIEENGILQIATSYTTGWKAYVDGVPTDTIRVNTAFIGIPLEAGEHQIYLEYEVPYVKLGIVCTLIGVLGFIVLVIIEWRCLRKK